MSAHGGRCLAPAASASALCLALVAASSLRLARSCTSFDMATVSFGFSVIPQASLDVAVVALVAVSFCRLSSMEEH